ncbi:hypothetical protein [Nonomuraea sp. SBT364]|uniref:hypothetical protein n=1 Tax=Nonomuraea sp. SBT364 TaxID=1580530 RepID=UPI0012E31539|nr:hypothetical protein [Nonomuraea sp. SBT364]
MSTEDELRRLDAELAKLKRDNQDQRDQIREMGATDQFEISAQIAQADEQAEIIAELEQRRETLRRRLEQG